MTDVWSPKQEEEAIGDVDLFTVSEDGAELTVNAKWLQHLQERLLGEDGHPRKARCPAAFGLPSHDVLRGCETVLNTMYNCTWVVELPRFAAQPRTHLQAFADWNA